MRRILIPFAILFMVITLFASCLKSDDSTTYTSYDDTGITAFTLGSLNLTKHTVSSKNTDSVYTTKLAGSTYRFYIDQINYEIYNPDSLPYGTDVKHVLCTVTTKNSGVVGVKSMVSDSIFSHSNTDSLDFSQPRKFYVSSYGGSAVRIYTVRVNVHQEQADTFQWHAKTTLAELKNLKNMKSVAANEKLFLFGYDGNATKLYNTSTKDGNSWTISSISFDAEAWKNAVVMNDIVYVKNEGQLLKSEDGSSWTTITTTDIKQLIGADNSRLFACDANGSLISSYDEGITWNAEPVEEYQALLPTEDMSLLMLPLKTNDNVNQLFLIGNRNQATYPSNINASVWSKMEDASSNTQGYTWFPYIWGTNDPYTLPRLQNMQVITYGDVLLAVGGNDNKYEQIYASEDKGITWHNNSSFPLPKDFDSASQTMTIAADADLCLWMMNNAGQVWRGRLNKYGWTENQKAFTE